MARVLIIDDDFEIIEIITEILKVEGWLQGAKLYLCRQRHL